MALVADIEKAFLNVEVDKTDRDCLRLLCIQDVTYNIVKPVEYRFCRVIFGVNYSSLILNTKWHFTWIVL